MIFYLLELLNNSRASSTLMQDITWDPEGWNNYEAAFAVTAELAACKSVEVWIHQVNREWNIEVDDVQISASA